MTQEILPPPTPTTSAHPECRACRGIEGPPELDFTPVPRQVQSGRNTITADRQRAFIAALAQTGSVATASSVIGNAAASLYALKLARGAESFAAAWDAAVQRGARQVRDILVDHAINGTPEYIYKDGILVAERRVFKHRMMMWIVAHAMPEEYGMPTGLGAHGGSSVAVQRLKQQWHREWADKWRAEQEEKGRDSLTSFHNKIRALRSGFKRDIAHDPAKRAAWELLTGPTDWSDFDKSPVYGALPDYNITRPDVIVPLAEGAEGEGG